jgi:transcription-repair coupling factor (superfamily II helicase)
MAAIRSQNDADDLLDEIIDRYGDPPKGVINLIDIALLRAEARRCGVNDIRQKAGDVMLTMNELNFEGISAICADPDYENRLFYVASAKVPTLRLKLHSSADSLKQTKALIAWMKQCFQV